MSITFTAVCPLAQSALLARTTAELLTGLMNALGAPEDINMSNSNAYAVLELLGFPLQGDGVDVFGVTVYDDGSGECPAGDFLGRVMLAQALLGSSTDDEHGQPGWADGNTVHCGRRAGYLAEKLGLLRTLAEYAHRRGWLIAWS